MLNLLNCVYYLKNVYVECRNAHIIWKKYTLNVHNWIHSLKNYICWMYIIVYILWNCVHYIYIYIYIILYYLWKIVYIEYTKLRKFFEKIVFVEWTKLCTFFEKYVLWIYSVVYIIWKFVNIEFCTFF